MKGKFDLIVEAKSKEMVYQQLFDTLMIISENRKHSRLSDEETIDLIRQYKKKGDREALEKIVTANMALVYDRAKQHFNINQKVDFDELVQEGMLAIMKAVENYDMDSEKAWSTYLWKTVNGLIKNYVNTGRSASALDSAESIDREMEKDAEEQKDSFVKKMKSNIRDAGSILADIDDVERLKAILGTLPEKKKKIVGQYFGLGDSEKKEMPEIAQEFDMTVPGVSLTISRALKSIKDQF